MSPTEDLSLDFLVRLSHFPPGHVYLVPDRIFLSFFFFKDFIYLFDRESQPEREGTQAGGVGEEEAGSQWSLKRGSILECRDNARIAS